MPGTQDDYVMFSDVHKMLNQRYDRVSTVATSRLVKEAFSLCQESPQPVIIIGIRFTPTIQDVLRELELVKAENRDLKLRCVHPADVHKEMMDMLSSSSLVMTGPTVDNFSSFNFDSVVSELKTTMPLLYSFINEICDSHRNRHNEVTMPVEELKALICQILLLNAWTNRANGMQMLIGMMLVGRSTHKQVHKSLCNNFVSGSL